MLLIPFGIVWAGYTLLWYGAGLVKNPDNPASLLSLVKPLPHAAPFGKAVNSNAAQMQESMQSPGASAPASVNYRSAAGING